MLGLHPNRKEGTMTHYRITTLTYNATDERYFDDVKALKRYAKSVIRLGWSPAIVRYDTQGFRKRVTFPSLELFKFFQGVSG